MGMRETLIKRGVANLQEFGYPSANTENILTDEIYSSMFRSMLEENKGARYDIDEVIDVLLTEIGEQK
jgi:hypothetical protein